MVSIVIISMYIEQLGHWVAPHLAEIGRISLLILVVHIIDDDVTRIDAMNLFLLSSGLGAFKLAILDSVLRCAYTLLISFLLERIPFICRLFGLPKAAKSQK
jgi:uncharacterized membrane protein YcfT